MIGVIFHWGLYSIPGYDDIKSSRRRKMQNGSEWYLKRLEENGNFRPISGWKETQAFHEENFPDIEYKDFAKQFVCDGWNPDDWMKMCKENNAEYVILTSKHHDGFCLWDTKTTEYNCASSSKQDLLKEFCQSARKYGLKVGIYYSWSEFGKGCTKDYMNNTVTEQMKELEKYKPDIWWFDGDWSCSTKYSKELVTSICKGLKEKNPNVKINDRIALNKELKDDKNYLGEATHRNYGDRFMPEETPKVKWEHINTIGISWGYNKMQEECDYKTGDELYELYEEVRMKHGDFLINFGPKADGTLDDNEVKSFLRLSELIDENTPEIVFESDDEN